MNINYKQILTYFSSIAYHHEQIKSFGFGDIEQCTNDIITKQEPKYTRMYLIPGQVTLNQNHIHYNFDVIIMDKVDDDLSNLEENSYIQEYIEQNYLLFKSKFSIG